MKPSTNINSNTVSVTWVSVEGYSKPNSESRMKSCSESDCSHVSNVTSDKRQALMALYVCGMASRGFSAILDDMCRRAVGLWSVIFGPDTNVHLSRPVRGRNDVACLISVDSCCHAVSWNSSII